MEYKIHTGKKNHHCFVNISSNLSAFHLKFINNKNIRIQEIIVTYIYYNCFLQNRNKCTNNAINIKPIQGS